MESRFKLTMCRLCLGENECFLNIFEVNEWQGYVPAEVISDLLQFQVSKTDAYPHVACSTCLTKLTEFRLFKECCQKSKDTYDDMFVSRESPEDHKPELDEVIESQTSKCSSAIVDPIPSNDELISSGISVKVEPLEVEEFEFQESNRLSEAVIGISTNSIEIFDDFESEITIMEEPLPVELTLLETHPKYQECLHYKRSQCKSKGEIDADSCSLGISTNDTSNNIPLTDAVVASSGRTIETLEGQRILPGEYVASFFQQDINIGKEVENKMGKIENDIGGDMEALTRTGPEKGVREKSEGFECFHCGIVLMSKPSLIHHMKVHGFGNSYDCTTCGKVFRFNSKLKRHILTHTGYKPYVCAECNKCFSQIGVLNRHKRLHTGYNQNKCTECSKCFSGNDDLKKHMRTHIGSKPYKCLECSKCFRRSDYLQVHMRLHTGSKPFKCAECSKCFRRSDHLQLHMRSHSDYKPYKCAVCSKCFRRNDNLRVHMRSHTGYKPHKCAECSKSFSQICDLKRHNRIHTGSKPYKCADCSKCFTQNGSLQIHMRIHSGSKPYECTVCSRRFTRNDGLKSHMRIHTGS